MATLQPFRALRPKPEAAARIAAVPYDVVNTDEARALADGNPLSFLRVSRAELELPPSADPYSGEVYERAARNFETLRQSALTLEQEPSVYLYRLRMGGHTQTGLAACFSIDEYDRDIIKKHERTRRDKEDDRTRHMLALGAQTGPVFLTYRASRAVDDIAARAAAAAPLVDFEAPDGVRHAIWRVTSTDRDALVATFARIPALYISVLQDFLLAPVLEIADVRTDKRIDFVGGARGTQELERLVDAGTAAVAFALYPVSVQDLMAVADAGAIMPPKSTWFEPKLRDGLLIHAI